MATARRREKIPLNIIVTGGTGTADIDQHGTAFRTIVVAAASATYSWLVTDEDSDPTAGQSDHMGDTILVEDYPIQYGSTITITSDKDGAFRVIIWAKP